MTAIETPGVTAPAQNPDPALEDAGSWVFRVAELWLDRRGKSRGASWAALVEEHQLKAPRLGVPERIKVVEMLKQRSGGAMSNRAIAVVLGVSDKQVGADVKEILMARDPLSASLRAVEDAVRGAVDAVSAREVLAEVSGRSPRARDALARVDAMVRDLSGLGVLLRESLS
ncbi:hypothetical protein [Arthrobacter sp. efr-133-TYG-118]|uniref:hypothetical protein n=1 Tax=Arthrobacter sp. efr-133-TYG-118 TaxID=3040279 RepID=UPI00254A3322|nr:hypothetical protein [Arthrobacter sp. efr-133-TYG-118]